MEYISIIAAGFSFLASGVMSLIAWGLRSEVGMLRTELRAGLAEAENKFFARVNGNYIRKELHNDMVARIDRIENRVEDLE